MGSNTNKRFSIGENKQVPCFEIIVHTTEIETRWLTDRGLQRLTQSRLETSSSSNDDVDDSGSVEMGALGTTKAYSRMK